MTDEMTAEFENDGVTGGESIDKLFHGTFGVNTEMKDDGNPDTEETLGARICYGWNKTLISVFIALYIIDLIQDCRMAAFVDH